MAEDSVTSCSQQSQPVDEVSFQLASTKKFRTKVDEEIYEWTLKLKKIVDAKFGPCKFTEGTLATCPDVNLEGTLSSGEGSSLTLEFQGPTSFEDKSLAVKPMRVIFLDTGDNVIHSATTELAFLRREGEKGQQTLKFISPLPKNVSFDAAESLKVRFVVQLASDALAEGQSQGHVQVKVEPSLVKIEGFRVNDSFQLPLPTPLTSASVRDLKFLYDVTLCCGKEKYSAHKLVLSVVSPVFKKLFESSKDARLVLKEMEPKTLKLLLKCVYTGALKAEEVPEAKDLIDLSKAAHRYSMEDLKAWCLRQILAKVDEANALELLTLSENYDEPELKKRALEIIKLNKAEIFRSPANLQDFLNQNAANPELVHELFMI